ncbi:hypothetical protein CMO83_05165 [Candidatus Woesearchaeota archaeon]|jgi:predicted PurR-regulated permease PerM|nr:hypothetical protein [Candidatus Woesearchaeota archaeon]|tara:strand:- start:20024 stop:21091 length:1068 start_codon:yes stop_codon:yes gene_type:complete
MAESQGYSHIVHFFIFALAIFLFFKIVEPLITIFLTSIIITYISYPIYKGLKKRIPHQFTSIILTILVILIILLLPFSYLVFQITQESFQFYDSLKGNIEKGALFGFTCKSADSTVCLMINKAEEISATSLSGIGADKYIQKVLSRMVEVTTNYLVKIPQAIIGMALALFISYFLFRDGEKIMQKVTNWLPFNKKNVDKLVDQFKRITYTIVFAQLFVALIQGIIGIIGFLIFGLPLAIFWGVVMAFFALVPTVGTAVIWIPASLFLVITGLLSGDYLTVGKGIGLFAYGILVVSTIDNLLRVKIIHSKAQVHPIIVIVGVIGGVNLFGVIGLFLGPILLSLLLTYFGSFKDRFM